VENSDPTQKAELPLTAWPVVIITLMAVQTGLTLGLHCCEAIINATCDEHAWRTAVHGAVVEDPMPLKTPFMNWRSIFLLAAKPFLHWMFGLSFNVVGVFSTKSTALFSFDDGTLLQLTVTANCPQTWYLSVALIVLASITTAIAMYKPRGPQPAAYGHCQTLANLVDDWEPAKIYWGLKADNGKYAHTGTSGEALPQPSTADKRDFA